jgi:glycine/D-amino acid oxidase-like deaminating enzyme
MDGLTMVDDDVLAAADVVVIGAGVAGVCSAFELRRRGYEVVLVEQRFPAFGASGRGPGAVWLQTRRTGDELALARAGRAKYEEYIGLIGDVFDYRVDGGLFFVETDAQAAVLADYAADRAAVGLRMEVLSLAEARTLSPLVPETAIGAVYCADDAQVDAQAFVGAMSKACVRAGVRSFENTSVLATLRDGDVVVGVRTVRGVIRAPGVVWATGAWAKNLRSEGLDLPIETARMGTVRTQPIEQKPSPVVRGPRGVAGCGALHDVASFDPSLFSSTGSDNDDDFIASDRAGQFYIGGSVDGHGSMNPQISARATTAMVSTFVERHPRFADYGITGLWAGLVSDTRDHLPIVDRVDGVYVNVGHAWGMASGPICGQVLAELVAGEPNPLADALRADRARLDGFVR